jgi:sporulation protein YlmC with PRC-barrel domain
MDAGKLLGMAIVSLSEATRLGTVTDVLFATGPLRVAALQAAGDGTGFVIRFELVRNLGTDAVTVESSQVTQVAGAGSTIGDLTGLARLRKLKVVDDAGTFVGTVHAARIDPLTGSVVELATRKGGVLGVGRNETVIPAAAIRTVGSDVLTVSTAASETD